VDYFGIILHGQCFASVEHSRFRTMQIGDMLGFMSISELTSSTKHKFDVIAETDGIIALVAFGELKSEVRKNPIGCY
jgi:hypothetical protein